MLVGGGVLILVSGGLVTLGRQLKSEIYLGSSVVDTQDDIEGNSCNIFSHFEKAQNLELCGSTWLEDSKSMFVLGDSHGYQYRNAISELARRNSFNYSIVWGGSCLFPASHIGMGGKECFEKQQIIERKILDKAKIGDLVIVANSLSHLHFHRGDGYFSMNEELLSRKKALEKFELAFKELASKLNAKGVVTVFYTDGVKFPNHPGNRVLCRKEWFRQHISSNCYASKSDHQNRIAKRFPWLIEWENNSDKIVWSASQYQSNCHNDKCDGSQYTDSNHFTDVEAKLVFQRFIREKGLLGKKSDSVLEFFRGGD